MLYSSAAAYVWGFIAAIPEEIEVNVGPRRRVHSPAGVRVRHFSLAENLLTTRFGLPVTERSRSALDHLAGQPIPSATAFADRAISQGWLTIRDLERRLDTPKVPGNPTVRRVLRTMTIGAEAESERRLHRLLHRAGIQGWIANHAVFERGRLVARIDVAFPGLKLAIEVDGFAYHSDRSRFQRDRTRQNDLTSLGWRTVRFTWADLVERPDYVLRTIQHNVMGEGLYSA